MQDNSRGNNPPAGLADLDHMLDSAIASYSAEEPRPGLAQRVIAAAT